MLAMRFGDNPDNLVAIVIRSFIGSNEIAGKEF